MKGAGRVLKKTVLRWEKIAAKWAKQTGLETAAILAVIQQESGGNANAKRRELSYMSRYGSTKKFRDIQITAKLTAIEVASSYGLMQLMLPTAWGYMSASDLIDPVTALLTPDKNIRYGAAHLAALLKKNGGDYRKAFADYNGGGAAAETYAANVEALRKEYAAALKKRDELTEKVGAVTARSLLGNTPLG